MVSERKAISEHGARSVASDDLFDALLVSPGSGDCAKRAERPHVYRESARVALTRVLNQCQVGNGRRGAQNSMSINAAAPFYPITGAQDSVEQHTPRQYQTELFLEARKRNVRSAPAEFGVVARPVQTFASLRPSSSDNRLPFCR